jgi:hypothetical protein
MVLAMDDYLAINRTNWDERAPAHAASPGYSLSSFVADPAFLSHVVRFDLPLLGDIGGTPACTSSATSAQTRSRSLGWVRG